MHRNILLLQGPVGPFFKRFSVDLEKSGHNVFKINFNAGDQLFYHSKSSFNFTSHPDDWPQYLEEKIDQLNIDEIYLFGDCRRFHLEAKDIARSKNIEIFVFEEGYLRPNYITLEKNGVNGHSSISRLPEKYRVSERQENREKQLSGSSFLFASIYAITYYLAATFWSFRYPHYQHHRPLNPLSEGSRWILSGWRKLYYKFLEHRVGKKLISGEHPPFFLVALQVHSDMQVQAHSNYESIATFIKDTVSSFSKHAPSKTTLVIKHHPMDRGYTDYSKLITSLANRHSLQGRVIYIHDVNLPALLKHARAMATINSTVGLSAMFHGTPVKTLGHAIYDFSGLTSQLALDDFWQNPGEIDSDLFHRFRAWLLRNNQIKGSFYRDFGNQSTTTGLVWPSKLHNQLFSTSDSNQTSIENPQPTEPRTQSNHPLPQQLEPET